jgi:MFS family permease
VKQYTAPKRLWANNCVRGLCLSQFTALVGTFALYFASMALVEEITHSSTQVGLMIFSSTLPGFIFGLIAGPYVDRHDRIAVIKWGCILRVPIGVGFAIAMYAAPHTSSLIWVIYICNFLLSALAQFISAAEASAIPRFVTSEQLMGANSLFNLSSVVSQGTGIILVAPALLKLSGPGLVGVAGTVLFFLAWWTVARLPHGDYTLDPTKATVKNSLTSAFIELKQGWAFIAKDRLVSLAVIQMVLAATATLAVTTLAPGFANRILGAQVSDIAYAALPVGLGFVGGLSFISSRHGLRMSRQAWSALGLCLFGTGLLATSLLTMLKGLHVFGLAISVAVAGFGFALTMIPARTILQERPAPSMRGRVISTQMVLANAASTLPMPLAGGLADLWGIHQVLLMIAGIIIVTAGVSVYLVRRARRDAKAAPPSVVEEVR